jgi:hypothetical protein
MKAVAQRRLETHRATMAGAGPHVRLSNHVARVSCSDHILRFVVATNVFPKLRPDNPSKIPA